MSSISDICHNLEEVLVPFRSPITRVNSVWVPSALANIKINVDRSYLSETNRSVIGGVFHDHSGHIIIHFNKEISTASAMTTEVMAIRNVFLIVATSR